jgi:hypothetical protein
VESDGRASRKFRGFLRSATAFAAAAFFGLTFLPAVKYPTIDGTRQYLAKISVHIGAIPSGNRSLVHGDANPAYQQKKIGKNSY